MMSRPQGHSAARRILNRWKIPMTPSRIKPTTFRLVAQWLNQLCCVLHKHLVLSIIIGQVIGFPSQYTTVNHSYNPLSNCANFGCFNICHSKRPFTILLDAIHNQNWSFHFFMSWVVDGPILYEDVTSLQFSPHFKPRNYFKFLSNC